ncbi:PEPxxWA-CTERM sorting domain-containing protein [Sphingomonas nostoxanthinifaciens]|uniref:PEPxxWA-CTERM sorting domain-containing protein n=1 Tax=Sphingomonas nostoxanthinifaciens TaxID=2872652 RepID=UPI001CC21BE9|nr:PEPxxWA-CTERM sorting domain-containing protein [Sphingomonas nostoxanthinifaciens]UAK25763.1 PEPxxWA-CTERM sorting domain-containing protein [Sphingomonas nostoxanthinifaciens]
MTSCSITPAWSRVMRPKLNAVMSAALSFAVFAGSPARADFQASFYTVQGDGRDFGPTICCFVSSDEVMSSLGPDGLPVYNPGSTTSSGHILQDHASNGELTWFTPNATASATAPLVDFTSSVTISGNSYSNGAMFPSNGAGGSDSAGFQAAIFTGSFTFGTAQDFTFTFSADDDALLFVDGISALQIGGVHSASTVSSTVSLGAGTHSFKLFYADRQQTGAALSFSIPDDIIVSAPSPAPEPAAWAMFVGGFGLIGGALRRKKAMLVLA